MSLRLLFDFPGDPWLDGTRRRAGGRSGDRRWLGGIRQQLFGSVFFTAFLILWTTCDAFQGWDRVTGPETVVQQPVGASRVVVVLWCLTSDESSVGGEIFFDFLW